MCAHLLSAACKPAYSLLLWRPIDASDRLTGGSDKEGRATPLLLLRPELLEACALSSRARAVPHALLPVPGEMMLVPTPVRHANRASCAESKPRSLRMSARPPTRRPCRRVAVAPPVANAHKKRACLPAGRA